MSGGTATGATATASWARRVAHSVYRPDRLPGRVLWPALRAMPSLLPRRVAEHAFRRLGRPRVTILCVYRARNADTVLHLLSGVSGATADVRLWALDEPDPRLSAYTHGVGPGSRCELLNRLWLGASEADWVVVMDDDVRLLRSWTVTSFIGAMALLGADFAQPAHVQDSTHGHEFNVRRPLVPARRVPTVEVGPLFVVRGRWIHHVVPFPDDGGMGYYLEWEWSDWASTSCLSAVLDCVPMRHLGSVSAEYELEGAGSRARYEARVSSSLDEYVGSFPDYGLILWPSWRT